MAVAEVVKVVRETRGHSGKEKGTLVGSQEIVAWRHAKTSAVPMPLPETRHIVRLEPDAGVVEQTGSPPPGEP